MQSLKLLRTILLSLFLSILFFNKTLAINLSEKNFEGRDIESPLLVDSIFDISGKVVNSNGEPLVGASVFIKKAGLGAITNTNGLFNIKIKKGHYYVNVSYVGYKPKEYYVDSSKAKNLLFKIEENIELDEVVVTATKEDKNVTKVNMGSHSVSLAEISKMPPLMGEVDVVKTIQLLPGVQPTSDGGAGFSVRGGSADQNLILLDNSTVYNASHILGIFSVFNNDIVKGADLYKGDMPMRYGGRLSSLLQIHTVDELPEKFSLNGGIGLISSRLTFSTPLGKKTSLIVGGRRSYIDLFLKQDQDHKDDDLYFYDANFKLIHKFTEKNRIELNGYLGKDLFGMGGNMKYYYGNSALALNWKNYFTDNFSLSINGNLSHYGYGLESDMKGSEMKWKSSITDYSLNFDFNNTFGENFSLNYGIMGTWHEFRPGLVTQPNYDDFKMPTRNALEGSFYLEAQHKLTKRLSAKYGVRVTSFNNVGKAIIYNFDNSYNCIDSTLYKKGDIFSTYTKFEPRVGLVYKLGETSSLKADYVHNVQFLQLANNSSAGTPMDMWFCSGPNVKPQEVDIFSLGYFKNFNENMFETSLEVYYKKNKNAIDFADHAELLLNEKMEGEIRIGKGESYGAEVMIKKNKGRLTGFLNYTLSHSTRTFSEINNGLEYLSPYDKTHCANVVTSFKLNKKNTISATFIYATGAPTTYPVGRMQLGEEYYPIYSKRNEYRKPDYHRLDLAWIYNPSAGKNKKWKNEWIFSIYNAYNHHNAWSISYDSDDSGPYAEKVYLFGILPSITYNFKF